LWSADLTPPADNPDDASGAGLALAGGRLFVSLGFGDLVALDAATGREIWRQDLDAAAGGAPTVAGGLVYLSSRDARGWAVEADTGRVRWTLQGTPGQAGLVGGAAPAVTDRLAIFPFSSAELTAALREGGTAIWTANVAGRRPGRVYARISDISGDPVVAGNRVYAGSAAGRLDAVDLSSGEVLWSAREGAMSPVVVAGGAVFAVTDQAELVRLDAGSGARVWSAPLPYFQRLDPRRRKDVFAHYGPVLAGGRLWVASGDGQLRGFSPVDGALAATVAIPGGAATAPVVAGRTLYVVSQRGQLLAFR
jgi:outer membrane protein assembly factor BamB